MVLLYPIEQDRPNYTHKTVTVSVQGAMKHYRINEQVYTVNHRVNIESLSEQLQISQPRQISTMENDPKINLTVQPKGTHEEHENLVLIVIDFVQIFGVFNVTIELFNRTYIIENSVGIVENCYAKW